MSKPLSSTTKVSGLILLGIISWFVFLLYRGQKPAAVTLASIQVTPKASDVIDACETDEDCIGVIAECCSCDQGGNKRAIHRKYYSYWLSKKHDQCIFQRCSNFESDHFSCQPEAQPRCKSQVCTLN